MTKLNKDNVDIVRYRNPNCIRNGLRDDDDQHWPRNEFFGKGCLKSSTQVVKFGFVYASRYLRSCVRHQNYSFNQVS